MPKTVRRAAANIMTKETILNIAKVATYNVGYYFRVSTRVLNPSNTLYLSHDGGQCSPIPFKHRVLYVLGIKTRYIKDAINCIDNPAIVRGSSII